MNLYRRLMARLNPIPPARQHLASDFDIESQDNMWEMVAPVCWLAGAILLPFGLTDYFLYREMFGQLLSLRIGLVLICWLTAWTAPRHRGRGHIYILALISSTLVALLLEVFLVINRDPTGLYMMVIMATMVVTAVMAWPAIWVIRSNLIAVAIYVITPLLLGRVDKLSLFLFYCVALLCWAALLVQVHTVLTRIRWGSFRNRRVAADVAAENAHLYEEILSFSEDMEGKVHERTTELRGAYEKLERLDRNRSEFIHVVSHELHTPLTVFAGYSQMLINDPIIQQSDHLALMVDKIISSSQQLQGIVRTMLDVVKIDSGALEPSFQPLALSTIFQRIYLSFQPVLQERGLTLTLDNLDVLPTIDGDDELLYKVFYHLTVNAVKYTPDAGHITISGHVLAAGEAGLLDGGVKIIVRDNGIGISPQYHELIFTKFFQTGEVDLHSSGQTKFKGGGAGLGLAIARGIILAHNGQIWAESAGHDEQSLPGSQFHVVLPTRQP